MVSSHADRDDFQIFRDGDHIHLIGIESPGLTAAPAIGRYVRGLVDDSQ
jgi:L-2-hydroxyglutarate oxidase LhgO